MTLPLCCSTDTTDHIHENKEPLFQDSYQLTLPMHYITDVSVEFGFHKVWNHVN